MTVGGNATNAGEIRILEDTDHGCNYVAIKSGNVTTSYTLTLPTAVAGGNCYVLQSTNAGVLSWAASSGGTTINNATANELVTIGACTSELCAEANLLFDGQNFTHQYAGQQNFNIASYSTTNSTHALLNIQKSDNGSVGTQTALDCGENIGAIQFQGSNGSAFVTGANIVARSTEAWCSNRGTAVDFNVVKAGATALTTVATFTSCAIYTGGETANGDMTQGITIDQNANDDEILALKSSDIAHGVTNHTETDTYFMMKKIVPAGGGISMRAYVDDSDAKAFMITGVTNGVGDNAKSTSASGVVYVSGAKTCGTGIGTGLTTSANLFTVALDGTTRFVVDKEGDVHYDGSTNATAWDDYCDVELLTATRAISMPDGTYFKNQFSGFISDYSCILERTGVVHLNRDTDSIPFVSTKGLNGLIIDSVRQLHGRIETLETQLTALQGGK